MDYLAATGSHGDSNAYDSGNEGRLLTVATASVGSGLVEAATANGVAFNPEGFFYQTLNRKL